MQKTKRLLIFLPLVLTILFCMLPNLMPGIPQASDEPFHLARIQSLADGLRAGIFPVKVHPQLCYSLGYGVGFFYDNALLYFPAVLVLLGLSLELAYKIFIFCLFIAIGAGMYVAVYHLTRQKELSILCSCLYLLSSRIVGQLYVDFTLGNLCGAVFAPLAIAGAYLWLTKQSDLSLFIIGFTGLLYTHAITTLLSFVACVLLFLFHLRRLFHRKVIRGFLLSSVLILLLTAAYWLPMLQQFHVQLYKSAGPWTTEERNVVSLTGLLRGSRGLGILIVLIFFLALGLFLYLLSHRKQHSRDALYDCGTFLASGAILALLPCCHAFWHLLNRKISLIQFPARLFLPASILILFAYATAVAEVNHPVQRSVAFNTLLCVLGAATMALTIYPDAFRNSNDDVTQQVKNYEIAGAGAGQEWLPIECDLDQLKTDPTTAIADDGDQSEGVKQNYSSQFVFTAQSGKQYYDVPYIYYRGYSATDENGHTYTVDKGPEGEVRVFLPSDMKESATLTVSYTGTKYQTFGCRVSLITWILVLVIAAWKKRLSTTTAKPAAPMQ